MYTVDCQTVIYIYIRRLQEVTFLVSNTQRHDAHKEIKKIYTTYISKQNVPTYRLK